MPTGAERDSRKEHPSAVYTSEAIGLAMIAVLLLALVLIRYWHHIHWGWR
ncbi:MAG TPA: hypothetical protein VHW45_15485 [Candidatus Sulfotelmatobacter sp.]|jgi:hypothetical protein|nr:hypothetical protein [Candidatus Sulfotelmatobacter sp.]